MQYVEPKGFNGGAAAEVVVMACGAGELLIPGSTPRFASFCPMTGALGSICHDNPRCIRSGIFCAHKGRGSGNRLFFGLDFPFTLFLLALGATPTTTPVASVLAGNGFFRTEPPELHGLSNVVGLASGIV